MATPVTGSAVSLVTAVHFRNNEHVSPFSAVTHRARAVALVLIVGLALGLHAPTAAVADGTPSTSAAVGLSTPVDSAHAGIRPAADLSLFRPGNIISDAVFFDAQAMTEAQIQSFLESRVPVCQAGYTCLRDWYDTSRTTAADAMCGAYAGGVRERASRIIAKVAQACGINPQVILATLQKEQALVTHTWPSEWRYTIAMGQGCPDTAACDTRYYGFFNQVFGAAWQFKRYANPPGTSAYFTWYAPGKTWNVRYNPNVACGSSPVLIENQATANLYYYTPYQPNRAALNAGYGTGDGCSAYGNRNFFNYFTDWFGSPTGDSPMLLKTASSATVWLASQGSRWSIADYSEWVDLSQTFGSTRTVSDSYLRSFADRGVGAAIVRDAQTGAMSVLQSGLRWGLASCTAVAQWGGSCANPINISGSAYRGIPAGPVIGAYARLAGGTQWGLFSPTAVRVLNGDASALRLNGGVLPGAPRMSPRAIAQHQLPAGVFAPGELVRTTSDATVYMTDAFDRLIPLSSFATARDLGLAAAAVRTVDSAAFAPYAKAVAPLTPLVRCDAAGPTYLPASGVLHPVADAADTNWPVTDLQADSCALLRFSTTVIDVILLKSPSDSTVYVVESGVRRALSSWAELTALAGPGPRILTVDAGTLASLPVQPPPPATGTLVKGSAPSVYIVDGRNLIGLPSFALAKELGLSTSFVSLGDAAMASLTDTGVVASPWISCPSSTTVYFAASGRLHAVADTGSFTPAAVGDPLCARLDRSGAAVPRVFVKGSTADVYLAAGGAFSPIGSWSRLLTEAGGAAPTILRIDDAMLRTLPIGPVLP